MKRLWFCQASCRSQNNINWPDLGSCWEGEWLTPFLIQVVLRVRKKRYKPALFWGYCPMCLECVEPFCQTHKSQWVVVWIQNWMRRGITSICMSSAQQYGAFLKTSYAVRTQPFFSRGGDLQALQPYAEPFFCISKANCWQLRVIAHEGSAVANKCF